MNEIERVKRRLLCPHVIVPEVFDGADNVYVRSPDTSDVPFPCPVEIDSYSLDHEYSGPFIVVNVVLRRIRYYEKKDVWVITENEFYLDRETLDWIYPYMGTATREYIEKYCHFDTPGEAIKFWMQSDAKSIHRRIETRRETRENDASE